MNKEIILNAVEEINNVSENYAVVAVYEDEDGDTPISVNVELDSPGLVEDIAARIIGRLGAESAKLYAKENGIEDIESNTKLIASGIIATVISTVKKLEEDTGISITEILYDSKMQELNEE